MVARVSSFPLRLTGLGLPLSLILGSCIPPAMAADPTPQDTHRATSATAAAPVAIEIVAGTPEQGALLRGRISPAGGTLSLNGEGLRTDRDGQFLVGIDRDATGQLVLRLDPNDGRAAVEQRITVLPRQWNIQNINAPARGAARSNAEFEERRPREIAQMVAARRTVVTSDGWRQPFIWPIRGRISGVFGSQRVYQGTPGNFHNGVDVAAPTGTPYVAPADGVVILAATEPFTLEGYILMIDHGMGLSSVFMHSSRLDVKTGDVVHQGQQLGLVGATGRVTGPHMHWAMRQNGARIDAQCVAGPMTPQGNQQ